MTDTYQPFTMSPAGPTPLSPAALRAMLVALVSITNPDYTANLPGSLVSDIAGTDTGALSLISNAAVETVNTLNPATVNPYVVTQWGNLVGIPQGQNTNTSVYLVFSGPPGYVVVQGFIVSDGTYQYIVQDGGIIGSDSQSIPLYALATVTGSWAVPEGTVTQLVTSVPDTISLTVTNPAAGTPSTGKQSLTDYQAQVQQGMLAASQGMSRYLKTLLGNVSGVQQRLVSVRAQTGGGWEIIVGGGDPYQIANAIFESLFDVSTLVGSSLFVAGITQANPGVVSTAPYYHGLATDETVVVAGVNPTNYNGSYTATVISPTTFSIATDTTGFPAYVSGGVVTPNSRNIAPVINDYPDNYPIPIVLPPVMTVTMTVTWNTTVGNFVSAATVATLATSALAAYINSIPVGAPMNTLVLQSTFIASIAGVLQAALIDTLSFAVSLNGFAVSPEEGTTLIIGDSESYFLVQPSSINVLQG